MYFFIFVLIVYLKTVYKETKQGKTRIAKSRPFMKSEESPAVEWFWKYHDFGGYFRRCGASVAVFDTSELQQAKERPRKVGSDD